MLGGTIGLAPAFIFARRFFLSVSLPSIPILFAFAFAASSTTSFLSTNTYLG